MSKRLSTPYQCQENGNNLVNTDSPMYSICVCVCVCVCACMRMCVKAPTLLCLCSHTQSSVPVSA